MAVDPYQLQEVFFEKNADRDRLLKIPELPVFDIEDYDLSDEKEFRKYLDYIKRIVRFSFEYKQLVKYLREEVGMNECAIMKNINNRDSFKIQINIHHSPYTLEDIIKTVYNKRLVYRQPLNPNLVAEEVMYIHYCNIVGLIPLCEMVHTLNHANIIFIPINKVYGAIYRFKEMYWDYMDASLQMIINKIEEYSKDYREEDDPNLKILERSYMYLDTSDIYETPNYEDVIKAMSERISYLRENPDNPPVVEVKEYKLGEINERGKKVFMVRE